MAIHSLCIWWFSHYQLFFSMCVNFNWLSSENADIHLKTKSQIPFGHVEWLDVNPYGICDEVLKFLKRNSHDICATS